MDEQQERIYLLTQLYHRNMSIASVESIWSDRIKQAKEQGAKIVFEQNKDILEDV